MKQLRNIALALICFFTGTTQSCANPTKGETKKAAPDNNSILWEISGKGLTKPSFLFGTIHMICPDDYIWSEKMQQTFDKADKVCLEMDMDDMAVIGKVSGGFLDLSGKQLKDYFEPGDYALAHQYFKDSLGYDLEMFSKMKPVGLFQLMMTKLFPCDGPVAYEEKLMAAAKPGSKEIMGLETPEEQLATLDKIEADSIIVSVMNMVNGKTEDIEELNELVAAYKVQNLPELQRLMIASESLSPDDMKELLEQRNIRWIPRMQGMMKGQSVFFAVGAGHLSGEKGVIELLRKEGYTVTPVK